ncbi:hypothetical protein CPC08DRAFT_269907 [Agrocybe pediades]|nr:hypothetical protein CPC08DRAFT_269907 [Agrocybe pediades]
MCTEEFGSALLTGSKDSGFVHRTFCMGYSANRQQIAEAGHPRSTGTPAHSSKSKISFLAGAGAVTHCQISDTAMVIPTATTSVPFFFRIGAKGSLRRASSSSWISCCTSRYAFEFAAKSGKDRSIRHRLVRPGSLQDLPILHETPFLSANLFSLKYSAFSYWAAAIHTYQPSRSHTTTLWNVHIILGGFLRICSSRY